MDWTQLPWQAVGAAIPVLGVLWQVATNRGTRMARELAALDEAIAAAKLRGDPLQHAYRAVAFERLHRVYQRDRATRSGGAAFFWALYATLFWVIVFSMPRSGASAVVAVAAAASSFLALRGWARWVSGTRTLEAPANFSYLKAMTEARRTFIREAEFIPELEPAPKATAPVRAKIKSMRPETWRVIVLMIMLAGVAIQLANLGQQFVPGNLRLFALVTQVLSTLFIANIAWGLRGVLQPFREWVGALAGKSLKDYAWWALILTTLGLTWVLMGMVAALFKVQPLTGVNNWGWCFIIVILAVMDVWMFLNGWRQGPLRPKAIPQVAPEPGKKTADSPNSDDMN